MPDIDVSDLLSDTDIAGETFTVLRRQEVVNNFGESTIVTTTFNNLVGAVYPTGDNSLIRQDAFDAQAETITVVTTFRLRGPSKDAGLSYKADIVVWQSKNYFVWTTNDFSRFGAGFIEAECASRDFQDQAPA